MNILTCCSNSWVGKEATELCKCWHECLMLYEQQRHIPRLLWHFLLPGARWDVLNAKKKTQKWTWCLEVAMFFLFCFVFIELTSFSAPQQEHMGGKRSGWINYGLPDSSCSHWSGTMIRSRRPIAVNICRVVSGLPTPFRDWQLSGSAPARDRRGPSKNSRGRPLAQMARKCKVWQLRGHICICRLNNSRRTKANKNIPEGTNEKWSVRGVFLFVFFKSVFPMKNRTATSSLLCFNS